MPAIGDRDVAAAVRLIRERGCEGCGVGGKLLREVTLSRRVLGRGHRCP